MSVDPYTAMMQFLTDSFELNGGARMMTYIGEIDSKEPSTVWYDPIVATKPYNIKIGKGCRIDSFVKLEGGEGLVIGEYVHVASFAHLNIGGGQLAIKDYAAVAAGAKIISGSNQSDASSMSAAAPPDLQRVVPSRTVLEEFSCVLCNATVLPGVTLHEGAVLAAGAVATKDIPAWEIWAGVPAKFLRKRVVVKDTVPVVLARGNE